MAKQPNDLKVLPKDEPQQAKYDWPTSEERRQLFVTLDTKEMEQVSRRLALTVPEIASLERDAKSSASQWKARIEAKECEQAQLSYIVSDGREERPVQCEWAYECSGVDSASGERIYHPEKKALFRSDTGEFIECRDITSEERQMSLLEDESAE